METSTKQNEEEKNHWQKSVGKKKLLAKKEEPLVALEFNSGPPHIMSTGPPCAMCASTRDTITTQSPVWKTMRKSNLIRVLCRHWAFDHRMYAIDDIIRCSNTAGGTCKRNVPYQRNLGKSQIACWAGKSQESMGSDCEATVKPLPKPLVQCVSK